jgi:DNA-binding response OmpR family regulator
MQVRLSGRINIMKTERRNSIKGAMVMGLAAMLWCLPAPSQAAIVAQLDITGGSIGLNFGGLGSVTATFTQNGQLVMGEYQPTPNVFDPITMSHVTLSIFTSSGGTLNLPVPTAETAGAVMTADLRSLFVGVTSTGWAGLLTGPAIPTTASWNIGGITVGSFDQNTNAFEISWTRSLTGLPSLVSGTFSLYGTALLGAGQPAPVPLPGAIVLFGSGLVGMVGVMFRRSENNTGGRAPLATDREKLESRSSILILLVSPDAPFATEIEGHLARSGYSTRVVSSVSEAFPIARQASLALTLLDPRLSDWDSLRTDVHFSHVPIMAVVPSGLAYSDEDCRFDVERGMDGVHFCQDGHRLFLAKVGAFLRRAGYVASKRGVFRVGAVELDSDLHEAKIGAMRLQLSAKPFAILEAFMKAPSKVFRRGELRDLLWGPGFAVGDHTLDVHVHAVRKQLNNRSDAFCRVVTIKGVGFKLKMLPSAIPASPRCETLPLSADSLPVVGSEAAYGRISRPASPTRLLKFRQAWFGRVSRPRRTQFSSRKAERRRSGGVKSLG